MMPAGCLSLHGVSLAERLHGIAATFAPGQVTAICGPNGAGKSTLLGVLAGLLVPGAGAARLEGQPVLAMPAMVRARHIGYLPQVAELAWDIDLATLVSLGRLTHASGAEADRRAITEAITAMDLAHLATRPVSTLSGGERARALLARVLAGEPDWILADEPLASLDLAQQANLLGHFRRLAQAGKGVVLVLHDLAAAMNHADRVIVLDKGTIASDREPDHALRPDVIRTVWGVDGEWLGAPGARALAVRQPA